MGRRSPWIATYLSIVLGAVAMPSAAQPLDAMEIDEPDPVRARLASERTALVAGRVNILGVVFEIDPEWHIYWPGQNDTGMPTAFTLDLPEGFEIRDTVWPAPHRYESPGDLLDHVYEETTLVMVPVFVPMGAERTGTVKITADAEWLMCREACIPGWTEDLRLDLPVVNTLAESERTADTALFRAARQRAPRPIGSALGAISLEASTTKEGHAVEIHVENAKKIAFYPHETSSNVQSLLEQGETTQDTIKLGVDRPNKDRTLLGVLEVWGPSDTPPSRVYRINLPLEPEEKSEPGEPSGEQAG